MSLKGGGGRVSSSISLCADDFGLSPGVNRGVLEALAAGRLSAVSVMTTRPSWRKGASALRHFAARADIGLTSTSPWARR